MGKRIVSFHLIGEMVLMFAEIPTFTNPTTSILFHRFVLMGTASGCWSLPGWVAVRPARLSAIRRGGPTGRTEGVCAAMRREQAERSVDTHRGVTGTSAREGDPSTRWVTDIPAARDCHQQNVEAIQVNDLTFKSKFYLFNDKLLNNFGVHY